VRRFVVERIPAPGEEIELDAATAHHVTTVSRIARGEPFVLADGRGGEVEVALVGPTRVEGRALRGGTPSRVALHLVLAIPKGPALDHAVRMAVELGVTDLHPAIAQRSVVRAANVDRWRRIAAAAAAQSGRSDLPVVHAPEPLQVAAHAVPPDVDRRVAVPGARTLAPAAGAAALLVGPEGGLAAEEIAKLVAVGWIPAGLGPTVLRVDTAVAAGLASLRPAAVAG
jgi:16S rRNA (uracil1498-N3)-methyltransferase